MTETLEILPAAGPVRAAVRPPGSKSITNRALVCAALADGKSTLLGTLSSDDTQVMIDGLRRLGITVDSLEEGRRLLVTGCNGHPPADEAELFVGNSGTTVRFLTALACLGQGNFSLDGVQRMRQRPIEDLVSALRQLGADVNCPADNGCPPVLIRANRLQGGQCTVRGDISSQFLSGLLMAAPAAATDTTIRIEGTLVSVPYVKMTLEVMRSFGVDVKHDSELNELTIPTATYQSCDYNVEPDASAASYFWSAAAVTGGEVKVEGLSRQSLQGDVAFVDCLAQMGCDVTAGNDYITVRSGTLRGIDVDMNAISDTVQTLSVVALFAEGPTTIRNVAHIRHKETDRIAAVASELRKLGATVHEQPDGLRIEPGEFRGAHIETYDDHRMAMSFSLAGLVRPGVIVCDPQCTEKTYPDFFQDLEEIVPH